MRRACIWEGLILHALFLVFIGGHFLLFCQTVTTRCNAIVMAPLAWKKSNLWSLAILFCTIKSKNSCEFVREWMIYRINSVDWCSAYRCERNQLDLSQRKQRYHVMCVKNKCSLFPVLKKKNQHGMENDPLVLSLFWCPNLNSFFYFSPTPRPTVSDWMLFLLRQWIGIRQWFLQTLRNF